MKRCSSPVNGRERSPVSGWTRASKWAMALLIWRALWGTGRQWCRRSCSSRTRVVTSAAYVSGSLRLRRLRRRRRRGTVGHTPAARGHGDEAVVLVQHPAILDPVLLHRVLDALLDDVRVGDTGDHVGDVDPGLVGGPDDRFQ